VTSLDKHFEVIQNVMKQQLNIDSFDEFGLPVQDVVHLIGRIININSIEDPKLNETNVGLLNLNEENGGNVQKIKLQLSEVGSFSFFEGEIVVVEGTHD
jgi:L-serine deaminase